MNPKILTFNWHEGYIHLLAKTGYAMDIVGRTIGGIADWMEAFRPVPDNCRIISKAAAEEGLEADRYDCIIAHNLKDLMFIHHWPTPKILVFHNKFRTETALSDDHTDEEAYLKQLREFLAATSNLSLVFISESKKRDWGLEGEIILPGIDLKDYGGYSGDIPKVLRIGNLLIERDIMMGYSVQEKLLAGRESILLGLNPKLPQSIIPDSWEDYKAYLKSHRVYLNTTMPPYEDSYNLAMLEAMATGMPVVSLANDNSPIEDGRNGYISNNDTDLKQGLERLLKDQELAAALGRKARETVSELFPIERFLNNWTYLIKNADKELYKERKSRLKISVSMITLNEEKNIGRALSSCGFADEIVVVDGGSTDDTLNILKANEKVVLIHHPWENDFGKQRQVSLENCTGDWVVRLDADEAYSEAFENNIRTLLTSTPPEVGNYKIRQCNLIGNEKYYSRTYDNFEAIPRIWRNQPQTKWQGHIHETLTGLTGKTLEWDNYIVHYGFLDKQRYWEKGRYYSQIQGSGYNRPDELLYREYDVQPTPLRARTAAHVPQYDTIEKMNERPKVAIVRGPNLNQWEIQNYEPLADQFDIILYTTSQPRFDLSKIQFPIIQLPTAPEDPTSAYMIGLEAELFDKDVVYSADITWIFTAQVIAAKQKFGNQVIALEWENIPFAHEENETVRRLKADNRLFTDFFVAVTERARDALMLEGVPEEKIRVIPMGIDTARFRPDKDARRRRRNEFVIAEEELVVLFTGRMVWEKGIYDLIYAAKLVMNSRQPADRPIRFMMIGKGRELEAAKQRVSQLGLDVHFRFIESVPYHLIAEMYNMADLFVLPSISLREWKEQFGMVLIEAMACGLPVISTTSGSISEVVGDAGLLVPANDPTVLAQAINTLVTDDSLRETLGRKGSQRALDYFDARKVAAQFGSLFSRAAQDTYYGAMTELANYTQESRESLLRRIQTVLKDQYHQWKTATQDGLTEKNLHEFYGRTDTFLYSLVRDNYANGKARAWADDILNFCQERLPQGGCLNILDFGGGIGSLLIHLSRLKGLALSYADLPGLTFEYAKYRFRERDINVTMLDAGTPDFLGQSRFDVIIMIDVVNHLYKPEVVLPYLIDHLNPEGYLMIVAALSDDDPTPMITNSTTIPADREVFYNSLKFSGMEMLNKGLPRIFKKASRDTDRMKNAIDNLLKEKDLSQALTLMTEYLETHPFDLDKLLQYAEVLLSLGDKPAAMENLEKILLFKPDMTEAIELKQKIEADNT